MRPLGITTVIFDLDGTLCTYRVGVREAIVESLRRTGQSADLVGDPSAAAMRYDELWDEVELNRDSALLIREDIWTRLLAEHDIVDPSLAHDLATAYTRIRGPSLSLFDDVRDLLITLKKRYRLGLLTNGPTNMQWPKIEDLGIAPLFDKILVSGDLGIHKPDAQVFHHLLAQLDAMPTETLYVGNSYPMDVVGAKRAGLWSAWVVPDDESVPDHVTPDFRMKDLRTLREVLL